MLKSSFNPSVSVYLLKQVALASKSYTQIQKEISTKEIYRLRVSLRRIRTVLQLLDSISIDNLSNDDQKALQRIWKTLGKQRDLDVAKATAEKLAIDCPKLKATRKKIRIKTYEKLMECSLPSVLNKIQKIAHKQKTTKIDPSPLIADLQRQLKGEFKAVDEVHKFRIILKKVRYLLESFQLDGEKFKSFQDVFCFLNDLESFHHFCGDHKAIEVAWNHQMKICQKALPDARKLAVSELNKLVQMTNRQRP